MRRSVLIVRLYIIENDISHTKDMYGETSYADRMERTRLLNVRTCRESYVYYTNRNRLMRKKHETEEGWGSGRRDAESF